MHVRIIHRSSSMYKYDPEAILVNPSDYLSYKSLLLDFPDYPSVKHIKLLIPRFEKNCKYFVTS